MATGLAQFVRGLYFELQTIEGVRPLEIWSGFREVGDTYEAASLVKNLYKIVAPLVNERCFGRPFAEHSRLARDTVEAVISWFRELPDERMFERFPYPPTGDADQKQLYRMVKAQAAVTLDSLDQGTAGLGPAAETSGVFPDGLFDFREMRIVDNELPFIIFTDKEFRVIHGLAIVYLWLIDLDTIFLATLAAQGVDKRICSEYRALARRVHKENPLTVQGGPMSADERIAHIRELLKSEDYLDLFEKAYKWFEQIRDRLGG
jgi:hypothetical protein